MKLGVFTVLFNEKPFEEMLDHVKQAGLEAVEIGTGGNPGTAHCDVDELLASEDKRKEFIDKVHSRGLTISAFSCHDNPVSPNKKHAKKSHDTFVKTVKLAQMLDVPVVNTFSGTPGAHDDSKYPNWPVTPWPTEYTDILNWQWEKKLIPYWREQAQFAK